MLISRYLIFWKKNYGKIDPKRHLEEQSEVLNGENIVQCLSAMLSTIVFQ